MKFKSLKLHSQLIVIVSSIWVILLISIFATSKLFVANLNEQLQQDFYNEVTRSLATTVLSSSSRLGNLAISHSYWTELVEATNQKDTDWTQVNATKYLLDDSNYKIDELYLLNEKNGYKEVYGDLPESIILAIRSQLTPEELRESATSYLINTGKDLYIVSISGLANTDRDKLTGFYLLGQHVTGEVEQLLTANYADRADVSLSFLPNATTRYVKIQPKTISPVLSNELKLTISNIKLTKTISNHSNSLLNAVIGTLLISAGILLWNLLKVSSNFEESINRIKNITYHDYSQKIDLDFSKDFSELSHCINNLSAELNKRDQDINSRYMELISILIKTLEEVDVYTKGHSERVSHYSVELAKAAQVSFAELEVIRLSGLLHDVGKITVDTKILNKPGKLDFNEFEEIKKHPLTAYNILSVSNVFLPIKEIVKSHHEKVDGSGYPDGLMGQEIPLGAKIVAIADVFDSLISERSYRKPLALEEALQIIKDGSGTHFDPDLVEIFVSIALDAHKTWSQLNTTPEPDELYLTQ